MKYLQLSGIAVLITLLASCSPKQSTVSFSAIGLTGPMEILVQKPYGPKAAGYVRYLGMDTLRLNGANVHETITITVPVDGISSFLAVHNDKYEWLLLEPGESYNMVFDYSDPNNGVLYIDDEAVRKYNEIQKTRNIYAYEFINDYTAAPLDTNAVRMYENFQQLIKEDQALYAGIKMSRKMQEAVYNEIELFRMTSLAKVFGRNLLREERDGVPMYNNYGETWDLLIGKYPLSYKYAPFLWLEPYANEYLRFYVPHKNGINMSGVHTLAEAWREKYNFMHGHIKGEKIREIVMAVSLIQDAVNNNTKDEALLPHIENFLAGYGDSPFSSVISGFAEEIKEYHRVIAANDSPDIKFVENYDRILTLEEVLAKFKGKPLFIDFWFATCGPCHEQFRYNGPLKQFLKENGIEMLYISIDSPELEKDWRNAIKYYDLTGWHVRTDHQLHVDMDKNYGIHMFPTYMLVDANGNIIIERAKEPSTGQELFDQIGEALRL